MKKTALFLTIVSVLFLYADEIDDMVSKINSKRTSNISKQKLLDITSPIPKIVVVEQNNSKEGNTTAIVQPSEDSFKLSAIMNNRAYINGSWVKKGDMVGSYKLVDIMDNAVYLKNGKKNKMVFFESCNNKIKITVGR